LTTESNQRFANETPLEWSRVFGLRIEGVQTGLASADCTLNVSLEATASKVEFARENNQKERSSWLNVEMAALALSYNFISLK
jgi:hypothetical protein